MFSELIDTVITRTKMPSNNAVIADAATYTNATIRECSLLGLFAKDLVEDTITTTTASPYVWTRPRYFRVMRAAKYTKDNSDDVWPDYLKPGQLQTPDDSNYFYGSGDSFVFSGVDNAQDIDIAYYAYPKRLTYYIAADRPAVWDEAPETWAYHANYIATSELQETGRNLVSNWLLDHWREVIEEGTFAKMLKSKDDRRAVSAFALFKALQDPIRQEVSEILPGKQDRDR